jgi:hypothetical protein
MRIIAIVQVVEHAASQPEAMQFVITAFVILNVVQAIPIIIRFVVPM